MSRKRVTNIFLRDQEVNILGFISSVAIVKASIDKNQLRHFVVACNLLTSGLEKCLFVLGAEHIHGTATYIDLACHHGTTFYCLIYVHLFITLNYI